jgi:hypothetical protein
VLSVLEVASAVAVVLAVVLTAVEAVLDDTELPVLEDADCEPPCCGPTAWKRAPRNCCSAALSALVEVDDVAEVEPLDDDAEVDAVEAVDDVLLDDVTPNCASAAAMAAASGFVAVALLVDDASESLCV